MTMKALGSFVSLVGAITLMFAIILVQRDYQRSWTADGAVLSNAAAVAAPIAPERLAQANR
jgi:hypothetical protein